MTYALFAVIGLSLLLAALAIMNIHRYHRLLPVMHTRRHRKAAREQLLMLEQSKRCWGVKIDTQCEAGHRYASRAYAFDNAPALPIRGCCEKVCECSYIGIPERRSIVERRSGHDRRATSRPGSPDRRQVARRRDDVVGLTPAVA